LATKLQDHVPRERHLLNDPSAEKEVIAQKHGNWAQFRKGVILNEGFCHVFSAKGWVALVQKPRVEFPLRLAVQVK
jgi:hypothetical protein